MPLILPASPAQAVQQPPVQMGMHTGRNNGAKQCENCLSTVTPLWRSGPSGLGTLCNACGLKWAKGTLSKSRKNEPRVSTARRSPHAVEIHSSADMEASAGSARNASNPHAVCAASLPADNVSSQPE